MNEFKVGDKVLWRDDEDLHTVVYVGKNQVCVENKDGDIYTVSPKYLRPYNPLKVGVVVEIKHEHGRRICEITELTSKGFWWTSAFTKDNTPLSPSFHAYSPEIVKILYRPEEIQ